MVIATWHSMWPNDAKNVVWRNVFNQVRSNEVGWCNCHCILFRHAKGMDSLHCGVSSFDRILLRKKHRLQPASSENVDFRENITFACLRWRQLRKIGLNWLQKLSWKWLDLERRANRVNVFWDCIGTTESSTTVRSPFLIFQGLKSTAPEYCTSITHVFQVEGWLDVVGSEVAFCARVLSSLSVKHMRCDSCTSSRLMHHCWFIAIAQVLHHNLKCSWSE